MQFAIDIALSLIYFAGFLLICAWSWRFWIMYKQQQHLMKIDWIMLEIKLPREIEKSPFAAEVAISSLLQTGGMGNKYNREFQGNLPQFASLEIASIEGIIHFYVRTQRKYRSLIEANFYAQYPGIEIIEAEDYTKLIQYHHLAKDVKIFGARYKLSQTWKPFDYDKGEEGKKELPADFLPIKTYVDYGLDKNPKEEHKIDPIAPMLEFMGAIGKGQHFWFQIVLTDEKNFNGKKFPKLYVDPDTHEHMSLADMFKEYKKKISIAGFKKKGDVAKDEWGYTRTKEQGKDAEGKPIIADLTYQENKVDYKKELDFSMEEKGALEVINRKISKPLTHAVVRLMYVAKAESFNFQNIFNILSWPKPFNGANTLGNFTTTDPYEYPWQNYKGRRTPWRGEEMFEAYVEREGFFPHIPPRDWLDKQEDSIFWTSSMKNRKVFRMLYEGFFHPFEHPPLEDVTTLNLEEIATMWHLPGTVVTTPTLPRIDSNKGVAPVNLPQ